MAWNIYAGHDWIGVLEIVPIVFDLDTRIYLPNDSLSHDDGTLCCLSLSLPAQFG